MSGRLICMTVLGLVVFLPGRALALGGEGGPTRGQQLFRQLGCLECHTVRGEGGGGGTKAPELATAFGRLVELDTGETVQATDGYLLESITDPDARTVKGYPKGKMPTRYFALPERDLNSLVAYIKALADKASKGNPAFPNKSQR